MILIYPPAAKLCEPPAGIARLAGALKNNGISLTVIDMNLEGFFYLYNKHMTSEDRWGKRSLKNRAANISLLSTKKGYENIDKYRNTVLEINKTLKLASKNTGQIVSLANFKSETLTPVKSSDLLFSASNFKENIYYPYFKKRFEQLFIKYTGSVTIGFSLNFLNQALCAFAMIGFLKKNYPNVRIILGGGLVTSWLSHPNWKNPFKSLIDKFVSGQGEYSLLNEFGVKDVKNNYYPDYSDFIQSNYLAPGRIIPFSTSGGCYWSKCTFCPEKAEKSKYLPINPVDAVSQFQKLSEEYMPSLIHIVDNAVSPAFLKKISAIKIKQPWYGFTRVTKHLADENFCSSLKQSGCKMLKLGIESGDSRVLENMNKGIDLKLVSRVLKNLKKTGIKTYIYLLFGTPCETLNSAKKTMEFTIDHINMISFLNLAIFNLPWFAEEAGNLTTTDFYDGDLSLYKEFKHPEGWNRKEVRNFLDKEFKKNPKIAETIKKDPPIFNSNHAPFF